MYSMIVAQGLIGLANSEVLDHVEKVVMSDEYTCKSEDLARFRSFYVLQAYFTTVYVGGAGLEKGHEVRVRLVTVLARLYNIISFNEFRMTAKKMDSYLFEEGLIPTVSEYGPNDKMRKLPISRVEIVFDDYFSYGLEWAEESKVDGDEFRRKLNGELVDVCGLPGSYYRKSAKAAPTGRLDFNL